MSRRPPFRSFAVVLLWSGSITGWTVLPAAAFTLEWARQIGTSADGESGHNVSVDGAGNVYFSGGGPNGHTVFLAKYDAAGTLQWNVTAPGACTWGFCGMSADNSGNAYVVAQTPLVDPGPPPDVLVTKYDATGSLQWTRQLGTPQQDIGNSVAIDGLGNVVIAGGTAGALGTTNPPLNSDAFVAKYDAAGNLLWTRQPHVGCCGGNGVISADSQGNVYLAFDDEGGPYLTKYNPLGQMQWMRQFDPTRSTNSNVNGISTDALGNIYLTGSTNGYSGGTYQSRDAFLAKYNSNGSQLWVKQFGTSSDDGGSGLSVDAMGGVYIAGTTWGSLGGPNAGSTDAFIAKYDSLGNALWIEQFGTAARDGGNGVATDTMGSVYIAGTTWGSLGGPNAGYTDAFIAKYFDGQLGDYNHDGTVDAADYVVWRNGLASGLFTQADYDVWRTNFGATAAGAAAAPQSAAGASVPEPRAIVLTVLGLAAVAMRRLQTRWARCTR